VLKVPGLKSGDERLSIGNRKTVTSRKIDSWAIRDHEKGS